MNYAGKFDAHFSTDNSGLHSNGPAHLETATAHATHAPAGAIIVPDAQLLFHGDFKRSGVDLILSKDHQELVLHDYFKGEKRAALSSPDGAHLTGDLVNALTGHVDYAQAGGSAGAGKVIGHVTKLTGTATAMRNGVSIILNNGDNVEKGDVVSSGSDSTLGITFIDGTVFGLSSNARMVLNEMVYDPSGSNNSALLSLVAGTISFVAGETAKHGDMKIDTPVATMGIRGTAVLYQSPTLVEIDFSVPVQGGPTATFQVLVEPDGTTGSYILFDKTTLMPLVTVDQAGKFVAFSNGAFTTGNAVLSPDAQKLIMDVFAQKFTDNTNIKTFDQHADTPIPQTPQVVKTASGETATATALVVSTNNAPTTEKSSGPGSNNFHIPGQLHGALLDSTSHLASSFAVTELAGVTNDTLDTDSIGGVVNFVDINPGDLPTVSASRDDTLTTYRNGAGADLTLNDLQKADIKAVSVDLVVVQNPNNNNNGSATWTYSVPDNAFDFLAAGETLTLHFNARVDNNFAPFDEFTTIPFTITITGTNDVPVITSDQQIQAIHFSGGTGTTGGPLPLLPSDPGGPSNVTSGTFAFTDVDLTDTHTVTTALTSASMSGTTLDLQSLEDQFPTPFAAFENALTASIVEPTDDSTGTGAGTINWQFADLPVFLADFIPKGQTLTLDYTVTVDDGQGGTDTKTVEVTIVGTDPNAEVWIRTTTNGVPSSANGLWTNGQNWETGVAPVATDGVIIITDQLHALNPSHPDPVPAYPVTIDAGTQAAANSVMMDDFSSTPPELDILANGSLAIGTVFTLNANSILHNSGTLTVAGKMELLDRVVPNQPTQLNQSVVLNSGTIKLGQGGDFQGLSDITNTGTIEVQGGALNILVDVANSDLGNTDPGEIIVDSGATVALDTDVNNGPGITGGIAGGTGHGQTWRHAGASRQQRPDRRPSG